MSLWIRNIQLSALTLPFGMIQILITDSAEIKSKGFFFGYNILVWSVVLLQAQGGLLCAVVVKYADNILKGFATSLAIVLSCVLSIYLFDFQITLLFSVGAAMVIGSVFFYSSPTPPNISKYFISR